MDVVSFLQAFGYVGIFLLLVVETGFLVGFFLPGDTLLVSAGILAAQGFFSFPLVLTVIVFGALAGDMVGYLIGKVLGPRVFSRENSFLLDPAHLDTARTFYYKYGRFAVMMGHFFPIIRTAVPTFAGVGKMSIFTFLLYDCIGILLWALGFVSVGYYFGSLVPHLDRYIGWVLGGVVVVSLFSAGFHLWKHKRRSRI